MSSQKLWLPDFLCRRLLLEGPIASGLWTNSWRRFPTCCIAALPARRQQRVGRPADWKSAIQQVGNLRYVRMGRLCQWPYRSHETHGIRALPTGRFSANFCFMSSVAEIESAIERLSPAEVVELA